MKSSVTLLERMRDVQGCGLMGTCTARCPAGLPRLRRDSLVRATLARTFAPLLSQCAVMLDGVAPAAKKLQTAHLAGRIIVCHKSFAVLQDFQRVADRSLADLDVGRAGVGVPVELRGPLACARVGYLLYVFPETDVEWIDAVEGLNALREVEGVDEIVLVRGPGQRIDWREGSEAHVFHLTGTTRDLDELRRLIDATVKLVRIEGHDEAH